MQPGLSCPLCVCGSFSLLCNHGVTASLLWFGKGWVWKRMGFALEWNEENFCSFQKNACGTKSCFSQKSTKTRQATPSWWAQDSFKLQIFSLFLRGGTLECHSSQHHLQTGRWSGDHLAGGNEKLSKASFCCVNGDKKRILMLLCLRKTWKSIY